MGRKVFISYKYADEDVSLQYLACYALIKLCDANEIKKEIDKGEYEFYENIKLFIEEMEKQNQKITVRDYVDLIQEVIGEEHINKGEKDDEDLSDKSDDQIWELLKEKMYDSSITLVIISPNMKELNKRERNQWIPWEISYSLRRTTRGDKTSDTNAILAVVLPDSNDNYDYFITQSTCQYCNDTITSSKTQSLFGILHKNMFNKSNPIKCKKDRRCNCYCDENNSYISVVKFEDFIENYNDYFDIAISIKDNIQKYNVTKEV
ncbi:MAG: TIR domain-containing protein [Ignavibacteria bacterium]|jgi:hypothetical protein|nr:TIR domain-containing protein [Ignavibacteria bacterium]